MYEIHNQAIRKENDCKNTSLVQSATRSIALHSGEQQARLFVKSEMEKEVPRFALPERAIDDRKQKQLKKQAKGNK